MITTTKKYLCAVAFGLLTMNAAHGMDLAQTLAPKVRDFGGAVISKELCAWVTLCALAETTVKGGEWKDKAFSEHEYTLTKWGVGSGILAWNLKPYILHGGYIPESAFNKVFTIGAVSLLVGKLAALAYNWYEAKNMLVAPELAKEVVAPTRHDKSTTQTLKNNIYLTDLKAFAGKLYSYKQALVNFTTQNAVEGIALNLPVDPGVFNATADETATENYITSLKALNDAYKKTSDNIVSAKTQLNKEHAAKRMLLTAGAVATSMLTMEALQFAVTKLATK